MTVGEMFFGVVFFFVLFAALWIFIGIFADIFHRHDLSGPIKALWVLVLVLFPLIGALGYIILRPKRDEEDVAMIADYESKRATHQPISAADEIVKLSQLHEDGGLSDAEFARLKQQAM